MPVCFLKQTIADIVNTTTTIPTVTPRTMNSVLLSGERCPADPPDNGDRPGCAVGSLSSSSTTTTSRSRVTPKVGVGRGGDLTLDRSEDVGVSPSPTAEQKENIY